MLEPFIRAVGVLTLAALAGGLIVSLIVFARGAKAEALRSRHFRRLRAFLFRLSLGSFVLVILLTLLEFMLRTLQHA
ncbi:MAG TPA: hypothetical protein VFG50_14605 [Rhodothermales bacterium]|nr:hypothetical protein [Rhodothermales bacterium]